MRINRGVAWEMTTVDASTRGSHEHPVTWLQWTWSTIRWEAGWITAEVDVLKRARNSSSQVSTRLKGCLPQIISCQDKFPGLTQHEDIIISGQSVQSYQEWVYPSQILNIWESGITEGFIYFLLLYWIVTIIRTTNNSANTTCVTTLQILFDY